MLLSEAGMLAINIDVRRYADLRLHRRARRSDCGEGDCAAPGPALGAAPSAAGDEAMKRSSNRILTTHVGSLIRPPALLEFLRAKQSGQGL